jgi:hypothetical protein
MSLAVFSDGADRMSRVLCDGCDAELEVAKTGPMATGNGACDFYFCGRALRCQMYRSWRKRGAVFRRDLVGSLRHARCPHRGEGGTRPGSCHRQPFRRTSAQLALRARALALWMPMAGTAGEADHHSWSAADLKHRPEKHCPFSSIYPSSFRGTFSWARRYWPLSISSGPF